jgi:hypothetical protein
VTFTLVRPSAPTPETPPVTSRRVGRGRARYVVAVIGIIATLVTVVVTAHRPGVYWATVQVRFIAPTSAANPNTLPLSGNSIVMVAGAVGQMVNDNQGPRTSSPTVDITGLGIRDGWTVTLPNTGGQWASNFTSPYLQVQAIGPTIAKVGANMARLINEISVDLVALEKQSGVDPHNYIRTQLNPLNGPTYYYQSGSRVRAVIGTLALGLGLTVGGVYAANAYSRRRRRSAA